MTVPDTLADLADPYADVPRSSLAQRLTDEGRLATRRPQPTPATATGQHLDFAPAPRNAGCGSYSSWSPARLGSVCRQETRACRSGPPARWTSFKADERRVRARAANSQRSGAPHRGHRWWIDATYAKTREAGRIVSAQMWRWP